MYLYLCRVSITCGHIIGFNNMQTNSVGIEMAIEAKL
jgi:hypothetical protein